MGIGFVRCGRSACRISKLKWKMGKETGGKKKEDPHSLKSNEMAECSFQPQQPLVCQLQELRGSLPRGFHGWQRRRHVGQDYFWRAEGRCRRWRQEEVS